MANKESNLHDGFLQLKQDIMFVKKHYAFLTLKTQHIDALQDILVKSNLHENLLLMQRGLFKNNICNFLVCEIKIFD